MKYAITIAILLFPVAGYSATAHEYCSAFAHSYAETLSVYGNGARGQNFADAADTIFHENMDGLSQVNRFVGGSNYSELATATVSSIRGMTRTQLRLTFLFDDKRNGTDFYKQCMDKYD